jgi:hypothetical protein
VLETFLLFMAAQDDITGFVYCPPDWDKARLLSETDRIKKIASSTCTDIVFIPASNKIEILGDNQEEVFKAQQELNDFF